ncbi:FHA domain-containing protein [bacterium]|nr:MAG: FHA domain-containing protein [bacterium]MCL4232094.1 FHA domain-containing protein [Dehalococcoidia bacterium]
MSGDTELLVLRLGLLAIIFAFVLAASLGMLTGLRREAPRASTAPGRSTTGPRLVVEGVARTGMRPGDVFALAGEMTIGRDPSSGILLADPSVSGHHATIQRTTGGWKLTDAGSTNGTFVNGQAIDRRGVLLREGELIAFGAVSLRLHV